VRNLIILFAIACLFGCNPAYKRPDSIDIAYVRFLPLEEQGYHSLVAAYTHNGDTCSGAKKIKQVGGWGIGGMDLSDADQGMFKDPKVSYKSGQYFETAVSSTGRFYFTVASSENIPPVSEQRVSVVNGKTVINMSEKCFITSSFVPVQGAQYEVSYVTGLEECHLKIDRISQGKDGFHRVPESTSLQRKEACKFFWN
jgi:hypothetical protein